MAGGPEADVVMITRPPGALTTRVGENAMLEIFAGRGVIHPARDVKRWDSSQAATSAEGARRDLEARPRHQDEL